MHTGLTCGGASTQALLGFPSGVAIFLAELLLIARLALLGFVIARLRSESVFLRTVMAGVGVALVAPIIVVVKVVLTH